MKLTVHLVPGAKTTEVVGFEGQTVKIRISAPPIEGRANEALIRFLADKLDLAPSELSIKTGLSSKYKVIEIPLPEVDVREALK